MSDKPIVYDLYCGLGGWSEAFLAEGYECIGFDIEAHEYAVPDAGEDEDGMKRNPDGTNHGSGSWFAIADSKNRGAKGTKPVDKRGWTQGCAISLGMEGANNQPRTRILRYPGKLILRDVRSIHGSELKDAAVIVASPPCQEYSYMAMPWSKAKAKQAAILADTTGTMRAHLTDLFNQCFRIQREAIEAAGHYIPMVVENVRGAQKWVGRARWAYGSFYLWGDVPALMPMTFKGVKVASDRGLRTDVGNGTRFTSRDCGVEGQKVPGFRFDGSGRSFQTASVDETGIKQPGIGGLRENGKGDAWFQDGAARSGSKSNARKAASAMIAKIPYPLAQWIARTFKSTVLSSE